MNKKRLFLLLFWGLINFCFRAAAQPLVCADQLIVSLDQNCTMTLEPFQVLENNCNGCALVVETDRTPPLGNGPWEGPMLTKTDVGKLYHVRLRDTNTGNTCWGTLEVVDKVSPVLDCNGLTTVNITSGGTVVLQAADVQIAMFDACTDPGQFVIKVDNNQNSKTYTCTDQGIQSLQVKVSDPSGNTATCTTAVLVNDPNGYCTSCVDCPPAQTVTFQQAHNVLIPALQAGDLTPFDAYGFPSFSFFCPGDTVYNVTHQPSALGYSWFVRHWDSNLSGQVTGSCDQLILYPSTQQINVSGKVYFDSLTNCIVDPGESGTNIFTVIATILPGNQQVSATCDVNGDYSLDLTLTALDTLVEVRVELPNGISTGCPNILAIPTSNALPAYVQNFGLYAEQQHPEALLRQQ